jgi:hypothetical protein
MGPSPKIPNFVGLMQLPKEQLEHTLQPLN